MNGSLTVEFDDVSASERREGLGYCVSDNSDCTTDLYATTIHDGFVETNVINVLCMYIYIYVSLSIKVYSADSNLGGTVKLDGILHT